MNWGLMTMTEVFAKILETENLQSLLEEMIEKENWSVHSVQHISVVEPHQYADCPPVSPVQTVFIFASRYLHS